MSSNSNPTGSTVNALTADEKPPDGLLIALRPPVSNSEAKRRQCLIDSKASYDSKPSRSTSIVNNSPSVNSSEPAQSSPPLMPATNTQALSALERRKLVEMPLPTIRYYGFSGGHGGTEMPPTVDANTGKYAGDNPWRNKRKPSISDYDGTE